MIHWANLTFVVYHGFKNIIKVFCEYLYYYTSFVSEGADTLSNHAHFGWNKF